MKRIILSQGLNRVACDATACQVSFCFDEHISEAQRHRDTVSLVNAGRCCPAGYNCDVAEQPHLNVLNHSRLEFAFSRVKFCHYFGFGQEASGRVCHGPIVCQNSVDRFPVAVHPCIDKTLLNFDLTQLCRLLVCPFGVLSFCKAVIPASGQFH
jgi:hypothetical protein